MSLIKSFVVVMVLLVASTTPSFSQVWPSDQSADSLITAIIKVKGITCSMDLKIISANVEKLNGVGSCKPGKHGTTTTFHVKYNPTLISEKEIFLAIENTGSCEKPDERPYKVKQ